MPYINKTTGQYPISELDIRYANPNTSFTEPFVAPAEYAWVFPMPVPTPANPVLQMARQAAPVIDSKGNYVESWEVVDRFQDYTDQDGKLVTKAEQESKAIAADAAQKAATLKSSIEQAVQNRLDSFAKERNYDGILSACTYATSTVPKFQTEGQCCVNSRDSTWAVCYQILADVQAGARPMPTLEQVLSELPQLTWPA